MILEEEFTAMVAGAKPLEKIQYYRGDLVLARDTYHGMDATGREMARETGRLADLAWFMCSKGMGALAQERVGPHDYKYLFIKGKQTGRK